ncbi:MAG: DUF2442 domain-containing protein [Lentisphaerae bacterium]|nr:DUF2442 domain-containing protein [Lentisphaerota bacterium]
MIGAGGFEVCLTDGRRITVPYECYPRLLKASEGQRNHFEVYAQGKMLHWPEIDEDIEVQHIVEGRMPLKAHKTAFAVAEEHADYRTTIQRKG